MVENQDKNLIDKIQSGEVKMRPKSYFILQTALIITAAILLFIVAIFLISFLFFVFRRGPGMPNNAAQVHLFLMIFPWIPVICALLAMIILGLILKRYPVAYRHPMFYLPVAIILIILAASLIVYFSAFHERFERFSTRRRVPVFERFYRDYDHDLDDLQQR